MKVGLLAPSKKFDQFFDAFISFCSTRDDIRLLTLDYESFGRGDQPAHDLVCVFHKLSDDVAAILGDEEACRSTERVNFLKALEARGVVLFESLDGLKKTSSRSLMLTTINAAFEDWTPEPGYSASTPPTWLARQGASVRCLSRGVVEGHEAWRYILKTEVACGSSRTHEMLISSSWDTALRATADSGRLWILQKCVDDTNPAQGVLFKVYCAGGNLNIRVVDTTWMEERLRMDGTSSFMSHNKSLFASSPRAEAVLKNCTENPAFLRAVKSVAARVQAAFNLCLVGFDFLLGGEDGGCIQVVDVNYFPSYTGWDSVHECVVKMLLDRCDGLR